MAYPEQRIIHPGFISLYGRLKDELSEQQLLPLVLAVWIAPGYFFLNLATIFSLTFLTIHESIIAIGFGLYILLLVIFVSFMFVTFLSLATIGSRNPTHRVTKLVATLLITIDAPYKEKSGIGLEELDVLRSIAEAEQGAADWRGNYVGIIIIGAISFLWGQVRLLLTGLRTICQKTSACN